ncbi:hypothetical protein GF323_00455 [Candidatus Woesearchaeota archaeon]|nr:hypothetical protein [Candidatus Woesearchaeota archaeon]
MLFYTHVAFSALIGLFALDYIAEDKIIFLSLLILFASFPDMDKPDSKIGRKIKISKIINLIFGHRTIFHSLFFIAPVYILFSLFSRTIALSFLLASGSHLLLDALTPKGIFPLYPLKYKIKGSIKTGKFAEKVLFLIMATAIAIKLSTGQS